MKRQLLVNTRKFSALSGLPQFRVPTRQLFLDADDGNRELGHRMRQHLLHNTRMAVLVERHDVGVEDGQAHGTAGSSFILLRLSAMILSTSSKSGSSLNKPASSARG